MSKKSTTKEGYIYIFKCIVGTHSDICKIGKTKNLGGNNDRLKQHSRTTYYGFTPYVDFVSGYPIATVFRVKDMNKCDKLIKKELFSNSVQLSTIEIYNIDYDDAIEAIYNFLKNKDQFISIKEDGNSAYNFLNKEDSKASENATTKANFETTIKRILSKYNGVPEELLVLLRDKKDFKKHCKSHFNSKQFIEFADLGLVLDIHFNKAKRDEILKKLKSLL